MSDDSRSPASTSEPPHLPDGWTLTFERTRPGVAEDAGRWRLRGPDYDCAFSGFAREGVPEEMMDAIRGIQASEPNDEHPAIVRLREHARALAATFDVSCRCTGRCEHFEAHIAAHNAFNDSLRAADREAHGEFVRMLSRLRASRPERQPASGFGVPRDAVQCEWCSSIFAPDIATDVEHLCPLCGGATKSLVSARSASSGAEDTAHQIAQENAVLDAGMKVQSQIQLLLRIRFAAGRALSDGAKTSLRRALEEIISYIPEDPSA